FAVEILARAGRRHEHAFNLVADRAYPLRLLAGAYRRKPLFFRLKAALQFLFALRTRRRFRLALLAFGLCLAFRFRLGLALPLRLRLAARFLRRAFFFGFLLPARRFLLAQLRLPGFFLAAPLLGCGALRGFTLPAQFRLARFLRTPRDFGLFALTLAH